MFTTATRLYGTTETGGVGTLGMDCPAHQGIHVWEDHYVIEVIKLTLWAVFSDVFMQGVFPVGHDVEVEVLQAFVLEDRVPGALDG